MATPGEIPAIAALVAVCACDGTLPGGAAAYEVQELRVGDALDVLFVIEDAGSIFERQQPFAVALASLLAQLRGSDGELPSLHVGVVSTSPGTPGYELGGCRPDGEGGLLQSTPRGEMCAGPAGAYIADERTGEGGRRRNYEGDLAEIFRCIAVLGNAGCSFEQPLESLRLALDGHLAGNAGFLRPDARLLVVFLAEEDDCSAVAPGEFYGNATLAPGSFRCAEYGVICAGAEMPRRVGAYDGCRPAEAGPLHHPRRYVDFLRALKADPGMIMTAGILGPPAPFAVAFDFNGREPRLAASCRSGAGEAWPAVRLGWFVEQLGGGGRLFPSCAPDFTAPMSRLGADARRLVDSACLGPRLDDADGNLAAPGRQLACTVSDAASARAIPGCPMADERTPAADGPRPCWWVDRQPDLCGHRPHQLAMHVEGRGPAAVTARCRARDR